MCRPTDNEIVKCTEGDIKLKRQRKKGKKRLRFLQIQRERKKIRERYREGYREGYRDQLRAR